jgi:hypothetical protein
MIQDTMARKRPEWDAEADGLSAPPRCSKQCLTHDTGLSAAPMSGVVWLVLVRKKTIK